MLRIFLILVAVVTPASAFAAPPADGDSTDAHEEAPPSEEKPKAKSRTKAPAPPADGDADAAEPPTDEEPPHDKAAPKAREPAREDAPAADKEPSTDAAGEGDAAGERSPEAEPSTDSDASSDEESTRHKRAKRKKRHRSSEASDETGEAPAEEDQPEGGAGAAHPAGMGTLRKAGIALVVVGAVLGGGGGALLGVGKAQFGDANSAATLDDRNAVASRSHALEPAGIAMIAVGGAALVAGVVAIALPNKRAAYASRSWWVAPTAGGVFAGGSF